MAGIAAGAVPIAFNQDRLPWLPLCLALGLALVGLADDRWTLPTAPRLASQLIAGGIIGWVAAGLVGALMGGLITATLVNTVNFMDGINGITGCTMIVWGVSTTMLSFSTGDLVLQTIGVLTAGAAAGFLPWNLIKPRIFLGDAGSYLFGALVAIGTTIAITSGHNLKDSFVIIAPLLPYLTDVSTTLARRLARGSKLSEAHREHTYQRLAAEIGSHVPVAVWVAILSAGTAVVAHIANSPFAIVATLVMCLVYAASPALFKKLQSARNNRI